MLNDIVQTIFLALLIIGLIYFAYKRGWLKANPFSIVSGSHWKGPRSLNANFTTLRGAQVYDYRFQKNKPLTFYYDVHVESGVLKLRVSSNRETFFEKTFTEDHHGTFEFTPTTRLHAIILDGQRFKGRCECEFK